MNRSNLPPEQGGPASTPAHMTLQYDKQVILMADSLVSHTSISNALPHITAQQEARVSLDVRTSCEHQ